MEEELDIPSHAVSHKGSITKHGWYFWPEEGIHACFVVMSTKNMDELMKTWMKKLQWEPSKCIFLPTQPISPSRYRDKDTT
jgi:hypothetical protein